MHADAALFNLEYERWLGEHNKLVTRLRAAAEEHRPDVELRAYADEAASHYGALMALKARLAAGDPLHLLSGLWKGAAERCLLWIGGFRPSEIIKVSFQTHTRALKRLYFHVGQRPTTGARAVNATKPRSCDWPVAVRDGNSTTRKVLMPV
jgi:hypothetical protein